MMSKSIDFPGRSSQGLPSGRARRSVGVMGGIGVLAMLLAGCEITNPGPIQDEFLVEEQSHLAMVRGAGRSLVGPVGDFVQTGGVVAREVFPGGQIGAGAFSTQALIGAITSEDTGGPWSGLHEARFIGEYAVELFSRDGVNASADVIAQAHTWAGFANRLLGENFCQVAFDGGGVEPSSAALTRAETQFTAAIASAATSEQSQAAYAGRAQARLALGDWAGAASDASQVGLGFTLLLPTSALAGERNAFAYGSNGSPHRSQTVRFTYYDTYYPATGDPRVAWETYPDQEYCTASLEGYGSVPCTRPKYKHRELSDPFLLAGGAEMVLIRAEALLMQGSENWPGALDLINQVRTRIVSETTGQPLEPWTATSAEGTWTILMRERGIELWLDGRRLADLRRWEANGVPGDPELPDETVLGPFVSSYNPNDRCWPIPRSEVEQNTNIDPSEVIDSRWGS